MKVGDLVRWRGTELHRTIYGVILDREYPLYDEKVSFVYWFHDNDLDWYDDEDLEVISEVG